MVVRTSKKFDKKFVRLTQSIQEVCLDRIDLYMEDSRHPLLHNHSLLGEYSGLRSINITGDYRLIFEIIDAETIQLVDLDTHHNL
jgi:addiction module RelE/StbE family toxin